MIDTNKKSIAVTPRAAGYLAALKIEQDARIADYQKSIDDAKTERRRALEAGEPDPNGHMLTHMHHGRGGPSDLSDDDIAARALEIGAKNMLHFATQWRSAPQYGVAYDGVGVGQLDGLG